MDPSIKMVFEKAYERLNNQDIEKKNESNDKIVLSK